MTTENTLIPAATTWGCNDTPAACECAECRCGGCGCKG